MESLSKKDKELKACKETMKEETKKKCKETIEMEMNDIIDGVNQKRVEMIDNLKMDKIKQIEIYNHHLLQLKHCYSKLISLKEQKEKDKPKKNEIKEQSEQIKMEIEKEMQKTKEKIIIIIIINWKYRLITMVKSSMINKSMR